MFDTKPALASAGVIGALVGILMGIAQILGYSFSNEDQAALTSLVSNGFVLVTGIVTLVSAAVALWGRVTATKQIAGIVKPQPPPL